MTPTLDQTWYLPRFGEVLIMAIDGYAVGVLFLDDGTRTWLPMSVFAQPDAVLKERR